MTFLLTQKSCCLSYIVFHVPSRNVLSHRGPWNTVIWPTLFLFIVFCSRRYFKAYRNLEAPNPDLAFLRFNLSIKLSVRFVAIWGLVAPRCYLRFKSLFLFELFWQSDGNWGPPWSDGCRYLYIDGLLRGLHSWRFGTLLLRKTVYFNLDWGLSSTCKEQFRSQKAFRMYLTITSCPASQRTSQKWEKPIF